MCLPIIFGCTTKIKSESNQQPRICPRCHNASVIEAKKTEWFELFFVPLVPCSGGDKIWICSICNWQVPLQAQWQPALPSNAGPYPPNQQYQPSYGMNPAAGTPHK